MIVRTGRSWDIFYRCQKMCSRWRIDSSHRIRNKTSTVCHWRHNLKPGGHIYPPSSSTRIVPSPFVPVDGRTARVNTRDEAAKPGRWTGGTSATDQRSIDVNFRGALYIRAQTCNGVTWSDEENDHDVSKLSLSLSLSRDVIFVVGWCDISNDRSVIMMKPDADCKI